MTELIETIPFATNEDGDFLTRFPSFKDGRFEATFTCEDNIYTLKLEANYFFESADLSIINSDGIYECVNVPFNLADNVNYLTGFLSGYRLYYIYKTQQFELWKV